MAHLKATKGDGSCMLALPSQASSRQPSANVFADHIPNMTTQSCFYSSSELSPQENERLTRYGSGPTVSTPHSLVHKAFESIVDKHPSAVAARFQGETLTYQQLDIAANRLAHHLIESGLRPRQRVCLAVQRSFEMLIGIFAVLKAGCQYVPIDGGVASEQALQHIFVDTEAKFILCLPKLWDKVRKFAPKDAIVIALDTSTGAFYSTERPNCSVESQDGAYAIYTSGNDPSQTSLCFIISLTMQGVLVHQREWMSRTATSQMLYY